VCPAVTCFPCPFAQRLFPSGMMLMCSGLLFMSFCSLWLFLRFVSQNLYVLLLLFFFMSFDWKPEYNLGIKPIDDQHAEMLSLMGELDSLLQDHRPLEEVDAALTALIDCSKKHFSFEEEYFEKFDYPDGDSHKLQHDAFEKRLESFRDKLEDHQVLSDHLADFLEEWLKHHLQTQDAKYAELFKAKGL
jgi:hemerythrin